MSEQLFNLWGLSKELRRNIIIGFILLLVATIVTLGNAYIAKEREKDALQRELVRCKGEAGEIIDRLRNDHINMLKDALERQQKIEEELRKASDKLKRFRK